MWISFWGAGQLLVSTLPGEIRNILEKKLPGEQLLELAPMTPKEGSELLDHWLREAGRTLQPHQWQEILDKFAANGLPLYLRLAFEEARQWHSYDDSDKTRLSPDIPGVIRDLFRRLSQPANHGEVLVSRSLGYLAAGKNGLTEDELLEVLAADDQVVADFQARSPKSPEVDRLPVVVWSRLYFDLEPYLTERAADGTTLLAFYHRQLREVVVDQFLTGEAKQARHRRLSLFFSQQQIHVAQDGGKIPNPRLFSELPYQLYGAEEFILLRKLLLAESSKLGLLPDEIHSWAYLDFGRAPAPNPPGSWYDVGIIIALLQCDVYSCIKCGFQGGYDLKDRKPFPDSCPHCGYKGDPAQTKLFF